MAGRRFRKKRSARAHRNTRSNENRARRRAAINSLNELVSELDLPLPALDRDAVEKTSAMAKILRALAKRCTEGDQATRFGTAVRSWVSSGGQLPDGMSLRQADEGLDIEEPTAVLVPRHRVLKMNFRLQSTAFMMTYNSSTFTTDTWGPFLAFIKNVAKKYGAKAWSACLEESCHSTPRDDGARVFHTHAYMLWVDGIGLRLRNLEPLSFSDVRPRIDVCVTRGSPLSTGAPRVAALRGLFYVSVLKAGTLHSDTNYKPWVDYKPAISWVSDLWDQHKLSHEAYMEISVKLRTGHSKRKRDVDEVRRAEYDAAVKDHVDKELGDLRVSDPLSDNMRAFPEIEIFLATFRRKQRRRPLLLILGGTDCGKSELAARVLRKVCELLQLPAFVEVTVEGDQCLDFSAYDHRVHAGVLLDGVGDTLTLWKHREVLQGRPKITRGGKSATMMYAYPFTLARRAVVATLDLTAANLHLLRTNHWLKHQRNVIVLRLNGPVWHVVTPAAPARSPREIISAWTVDELAAFFCNQDAAGVADILQKCSVTGADVLEFDNWQEVAEDLRAAPFVAKKVIKLRDRFLAGDVSEF